MQMPDVHRDADFLLTPKEVKPILKISLQTVYNLIERGQLPAVIWESPDSAGKKKQRTIRIKRADLFKFIEDNYSHG